MNTDKNKGGERQTTQNEGAQKAANNPFENNRPADQEIASAKEELEKEQEFKEAQTERD